MVTKTREREKSIVFSLLLSNLSAPADWKGAKGSFFSVVVAVWCSAAAGEETERKRRKGRGSGGRSFCCGEVSLFLGKTYDWFHLETNQYFP